MHHSIYSSQPLWETHYFRGTLEEAGRKEPDSQTRNGGYVGNADRPESREDTREHSGRACGGPCCPGLILEGFWSRPQYESCWPWGSRFRSSSGTRAACLTLPPSPQCSFHALRSSLRVPTSTSYVPSTDLRTRQTAVSRTHGFVWSSVLCILPYWAQTENKQVKKSETTLNLTLKSNPLPSHTWL